MQQPTNIVNTGIALTQNLTTVSVALSQITERQRALPGIGVIYGPAGYGKSTACAHLAATMDGYYVQMRSAWNRKTLLEKILLEMGVRQENTVARMLDQICEQLAASRRPLIIDEFDFCLSSAKMVELVRDIYEGSLGAVFLVGEESIPIKLRRWERFHSRVLVWVQALPCNLDDAKKLAEIYARDINISDDLLQYFITASRGQARRLVVNLAQARERAKINNQKTLDVADWPQDATYTGDAPRTRRV